MGMNTGTGSYRLYTSRSYGNRRRGLTGNQLKVLGIVAILIDNVGAVLIQGGILHAADRTLYQAMIATRSGHIWMIAGQACGYMGRLAFPIFAFLVAEADWLSYIPAIPWIRLNLTVQKALCFHIL